MDDIEALEMNLEVYLIDLTKILDAKLEKHFDGKPCNQRCDGCPAGVVPRLGGETQCAVDAIRVIRAIIK